MQNNQESNLQENSQEPRSTNDNHVELQIDDVYQELNLTLLNKEEDKDE